MLQPILYSKFPPPLVSSVLVLNYDFKVSLDFDDLVVFHRWEIRRTITQIIVARTATTPDFRNWTSLPSPSTARLAGGN